MVHSEVPLIPDGDRRPPRFRRTVTEDGTSIAYQVFEGTEPAVVVLHGLAGSGNEFVPTARALSGRKVVLIDQRGHGASSRCPADTSREAFVADVVHVIEAESLGPVDLVGQSMGAHTAMLVAAAHPVRVRRLVMLEGEAAGGSEHDLVPLGAFFRGWEVPFSTRAAAVAALGGTPLARAWADDLEVRADGLYPRFDPDIMVATMAAVLVPRWREWGSVTAPTLVVYADGGMFTEEQKALCVSRGNNVTRTDLHGASHDAHLDAFDQWVTALRQFIEAR